jgi:hypothetical protein
MVSMLAVRSGGRQGVITTLLLPVAATVSFTLAALVHGSIRIAELVFLVVMFVAVWMRRFGPRWFAAGMAAFIGYFLGLFLQASFATLPAMAGAASVGAGAALLARFVLLPERPEKAWHSGVRALRARVHTLLHAVDALGEEPGSTAKRARAHYERWRLLVSSCATATRGFARVIGPTAVTCDADTPVRLGDLAATVADLADPAPDGDPPAGAAARGAGRPVGRVRAAAHRGAGPGGVAGPTLRPCRRPRSPVRT